MCELAASLDLSWPVSRESETLNKYLHLVPREIVTFKGIGHKKLLVIVSCVAHAVRELSTSNASLPHSLGGHYDLTASTASPVEQLRSTRALLDESLSRLKQSYREVLQLRFGLGDDRPMTLQQVASHRGVTRERIRQIESAALTHLRIHPDAVKLRKSLDNDADLIWSHLATGHEVVRRDTSDTDLLHRLDASHRLACSICDLRLTRYLDGIATRVDRGWYRSSVDQSAVERVIFQLEHNDGGPYPAPTEIVAQRLDTTVATIRTAVELSDTVQPYKGYIWQGRLGSRGRRSIWLHRILASVPDRVTVDTTELVSLHNQWRPHSACSYVDAEIVLSRYAHLFVPMGKGAWTAAGGVQLPSLKERDSDLSTGVDLDDETLDIGKNTIASSIVEILREFGPLRMSDITDIYCARTGDGKRNSVGPILITRGQFIRMAPGVYALYEHGSDQRAHEKGRTIIRTVRDCSEYVRAIHAGEPRITFPLWTYRMEQNWCEWAKECNEETVYSSLLSVAEPSRWQHASPEVRNKWIAVKQHDATYSLDSDVHAAMPSGSVTLLDLLAPSLLAFRRGSLGWVTINHLHGNRGNYSQALAYLGLLAAAGVVTPPEDWRLPHPASKRADEIGTALLQELHLQGQLRWESRIGRRLLDLIRKGLNETHGWVAGQIADALRGILPTDHAAKASTDEPMSRAIVEVGIAIAQSDGDLDVRELERIRAHASVMVKSHEDRSSSLVNTIIENALSKPPDAVNLAHDLQCTMTTAERHELMSHLFQIVAADGLFHETESALLIRLQRALNVAPEYFETLYRTHAKDPRAISILSEDLRKPTCDETLNNLVALLTLR